MARSHWHAQVEVNYIVRGNVHYRMHTHELTLQTGQMVLFWGGLPHQMDNLSHDAIIAGGHLPLTYFFRLRLPEDVTNQLIRGATLIDGATDGADNVNFERWNLYAHSGDPQKSQHAVDELLLRLDRVRFGPFRLAGGADAPELHRKGGGRSSANVGRMCDFIAGHFLDDFDSVDVAVAADLHPKYAMRLFKLSTGMTINDYVSLLRLSYAQALLLRDDAKILDVAMESGFGSLSAFNKLFRKVAGTSPSTFRHEAREPSRNDL